jgi:hypothetical protein
MAQVHFRKPVTFLDVTLPGKFDLVAGETDRSSACNNFDQFEKSE